MNAMTPPKLMPPFQSTAASGMLPTEQTKEMTATIGPTIGPQTLAATGCETKKNSFQKSFGTQAASAPAMSKPPAISFHTASKSMTKYWLVAVKPFFDVMRCQNEPSVRLMSISAWPSIFPFRPLSAHELGGGKLPPHQHNDDDGQLGD